MHLMVRTVVGMFCLLSGLETDVVTCKLCLELCSLVLFAMDGIFQGRDDT
jgi:hypothetical protein